VVVDKLLGLYFDLLIAQRRALPIRHSLIVTSR
jgi:hypothetical protein